MIENIVLCPMCKGVAEFVGYFGKYPYFRCRGCGITFSLPRIEDKEAENDEKDV